MEISSFQGESELQSLDDPFISREGLEERILNWLSDRGIHQEEPSAKKYAYFEQNKKIISLSTRSEMDIEPRLSNSEVKMNPRYKTSIHASFMDFQDSMLLREISCSSIIMKRASQNSQYFLDKKLARSAGLEEEPSEPNFSKNLSVQE